MREFQLKARIVSRLLPPHSTAALRGFTGHVAHPTRSIEVICGFFVPEGRGSFRSRPRGVSHRATRQWRSEIVIRD